MTMTAIAACSGPGSRLVKSDSGASYLRVECSKCHRPHDAPSELEQAVQRELAKLENGRAITVVVNETDSEPMFLPPKPRSVVQQDGAATTDGPVDPAALERERTQLIASLPGLDFAQRTRAEKRIVEVERQLHHDRLLKEAQRRDAEREAERQRQRGALQFLTPKPPTTAAAEPLTPGQKFEMSRPYAPPARRDAKK
jgi:hypothetical protein